MSLYDAEEEVWLERDNIIEFVIASDGTPQTSLSTVTRASLCIGSVVVDSSIEGSSVVWWTDSVTAKILPDGTSFTGDVLRFRVGQASVTIAAGEYEDCRVVLWDANNTEGVVVSDGIHITVYDACAT